MPASVTISKFTADGNLGSKNSDIVSGTFDMVLQNSEGKKIHITNGRFDFSSVQ